MNTQEKLDLIFRHTHRDFKGGTKRDGNRSILVLRHGGTRSVPLGLLTEAEIADKLPFAMRSEAIARGYKVVRDQQRPAKPWRWVAKEAQSFTDFATKDEAWSDAVRDWNA